MIPAEAVEAAARGMFALEQCDQRQKLDLEANWLGRLDEPDRDEYRYLARAALEAAAPHMVDPEAWHEGYEAGYYKACEDIIGIKPTSPAAPKPTPQLRSPLKVETYDGTAIDAQVTMLPAVIVSSEDQLNKLPAGSVVLSVETLHHAGGWPIAYQRWQDGDWHRGGRASSTHPDNFLPATVLHRPTE